MSIESLDHFIANQDYYVNLYNGKFIVFVGKELVGVYNTFKEAALYALDNFEPRTFHVQKCIPGPDAYTVNFVGLPIDEKQRFNAFTKTPEFKELVKKIKEQYSK